MQFPVYEEQVHSGVHKKRVQRNGQESSLRVRMELFSLEPQELQCAVLPLCSQQKTDPAVLVTDECGKFVISLLSGHLGGANELALQAAEALHAVPIVTTATDLEGNLP